MSGKVIVIGAGISGKLDRFILSCCKVITGCLPNLCMHVHLRSYPKVLAKSGHTCSLVKLSQGACQIWLYMFTCKVIPGYLPNLGMHVHLRSYPRVLDKSGHTCSPEKLSQGACQIWACMFTCEVISRCLPILAEHVQL